DVDLVILDMTMPDMDGVATFAQLQSVAPEVRVVVSSGYQQSEAMDQFPSKGPVCFVQKPFRMQTLIQTVKDCVNASA
ncbi:MAG: response regulator, partial [Acidobacteria bacterium]|nr:response regulator [Acidobacteriota bacterium]